MEVIELETDGSGMFLAQCMFNSFDWALEY